MSKGIIFNIQKFSIHDGPGIRTTVFLKGCPLRCAWCSNPESQLMKIQVLYDQSKCLHCQQCVNLCPSRALTYQNGGIKVDFQRCIGCLQCVQNCPGKALSNEGELQDINKIVQICLQDKDFYDESNGGVTISGGEGMSQPAFLKDLIHALKQQHLHVAIETTGYVQPLIFQEIASMLDLLLFDVKHYDTNQHYQGTKVHNELIIQNLKWAIAHQINILPRIPVIPFFNANLEDAYGFCQLFKEIGIRKVQLLPFHQFGEKKYELLQQTYHYKNKKALHQEDLEEYQKVFLNEGIECFF